MKSQTLTFRELIEKQGRISIPMLQRDYAQGRKSAEGVREPFVDALFTALEDNADPISLDFVYGSTVDGSFSPLDGQQRLTTLFLLHWYLAVCDRRCGDWKGWMTEDGTSNSMFTYEVRPSSRDFFNKLTLYSPETFAESPSVQIKDQVWFLSTWLNDPTILSALEMLDAMHARSKNTQGRYKVLVDRECPIKFHWLNIGEYPEADDLYIKMNARGKPLTAFEIFKARLEERVGQLFPGQSDLPDGTQGDFKVYLSQQMDRDWLDLFWHYSSDRKESEVPDSCNRKKRGVPDAKIMRFVREVAVLATAVNNGETCENDVSSLRGNSFTLNFMDNERQEPVTTIFIQMFAVLLRNWSRKTDGIKTFLPAENPFKETEIFSDIIEKEGPLSYTRSVMLYGYAIYLEKHRGCVIGSVQFNEWMRVVYNLAENTKIEDATKFTKCLRKLQDLVIHADQILECLDRNEVILNDAFDGYQVEEERLKAGLLLGAPSWNESIIKAEGHGYFRGQIGFLFRFCKIEKVGESSKERIGDFERWFRKAAHCFSKDGIIDQDLLWERALLSKGNYLLARGTHLLNNAPSADYNWKRLLRGVSGEEEQGELLQGLIENIDPDRDLIDQLKEMVEAAKDREDLEEWRNLMIKWPGVIRFCENRRIRRGNPGDDEEVYLLQRTDYRGRWAGIWAYALHLELVEEIAKEPKKYTPFSEAGYYTARSGDPCAWIVWRSRNESLGNLALNVERKGDGAKFTFLRWNTDTINQEVIDVLNGKGFEKDGANFVRAIPCRKESKRIIAEVAEALAKVAGALVDPVRNASLDSNDP